MPIIFQVRKIIKMIYNNEMPFDPDTTSNDVVILKLNNPLNFNKNAKPACLPDADWTPESVKTKCFASGWGALYHLGPSLKLLRWVDVPLMSNSQCKKYYPKEGKN